jgi:hypothetical protein
LASLQDFFGGMPLTPDALQALVNAVENLQEKVTRTIWMRRIDGSTLKKDTFDGDDVVVLGFTRSIENKQVTATATDVDVEVQFPVGFSKPPVVIGTAHAKKPLMVSVSYVTENGCTFSFRSVGSIDNAIDINGVSYVAIGPKAKSN